MSKIIGIDLGTDVSIYKKTARVSDIYYNKGLEKARVRDLSGAIETLKVRLFAIYTILQEKE